VSAEEKKEEKEKKEEASFVSEAINQPASNEFVDTEAIFMAKQRLEAGEKPLQTVMPKLFVDKNKMEVIYNPFDGEVLSVTRLGSLNLEKIMGMGAARYTFKFNPVTYEQALLYKRMSSSYDSDLKDTVVNKLQMRVYLLINHLRETNIPDENGQPLKIEIDPKTNGISGDSLKKLYETVPMLLDVVLMIFEKKLMS
jgi:hypothetical protein